MVVGTADPVGLSRLARGLVELRDRTGGAPVQVVVNRMRPTLRLVRAGRSPAWCPGSPGCAGLHFLPDDRATVDRALVAGRTLAEVGDSALGRAVGASSTRWSRPLPDPAPRRRRGGRSGGEQQVEPADGEGDHRARAAAADR